MEALEVTDNLALSKLTGLSERQIERCKSLLTFPERFQKLSLDSDPATRIPSNFWIEALPVLNLAMDKVENVKKLGRDPATDKLVDKYRNRKIKSVIHFRRIMEAYDLNEDEPVQRAKVTRRIEQFFLNPKLETREAFDEFIADKKRVQNAIGACESFLAQLRRFKLKYTADDEERNNLRKAIIHVRDYCTYLEQVLVGSDTQRFRATKGYVGTAPPCQSRAALQGLSAATRVDGFGCKVGEAIEQRGPAIGVDAIGQGHLSVRSGDSEDSGAPEQSVDGESEKGGTGTEKN